MNDNKLLAIFCVFSFMIILGLTAATIAYSRVIDESDGILNAWLEMSHSAQESIEPSPIPTPADTPSPTPEPVAVYPIVHIDGAVDLREYLPNAKFHIVNSTYDNPTGTPQYPPVPLLGEATAVRLKRACDILAADGYGVIITDGYRPASAQQAIFDAVGDTRFVSNPKQGYSWHNLGRAVDLSIYRLDTGEELEFPTPIHTLTVASARWNYDDWNPMIQRNVDYLTNIMMSCGFATISTEWWHFQDENVNCVNMDPDLDLYALSPVEYK